MAKTKLRSLYYEMKVEALINMGDRNSKNWPMLRIGGEILKSNFLKEGAKVCFPLVSEPLHKRIYVDDRIRITLFCKPEDMKKETNEDGEGHITMREKGAKYELWEDVNDSWACLYERWEKDS